MDADFLHPNLARIAAAYDAIRERFGAGLLTAQQAKAEIAALAARDDNGVVWSIDPDSGEWHYKTHDGRLRPGTPPTWGYATPSAYELTRNPQGERIDQRITYQQVGDVRLPPGALRGETQPTNRVPLADLRKKKQPTRPGLLWLLLLASTALALVNLIGR
jgi:hypothetical protein